MRLVEMSYGTDCKIFSERPYGYKRFIVEWSDGRTSIYSGLWYSIDKVIQLVEKQL